MKIQRRRSLSLISAATYLTVSLMFTGIAWAQSLKDPLGYPFYDPGSNGINCNPTSSTKGYGAISGMDITVYSPQTGGDAIEGGLESARSGLDGKALVRTLDDVHAGTSAYVTLAGDPSFYKKTYTIPSITYTSYASNNQGESITLTNVTAYVHDTGSAFTGKPEGRYDVAVGKNYSNAQMNSQPFANHSPKTEPKFQLVASTGTTPGVSVNTGSVSGPVYMLGDSITLGAEDKLQAAFTSSSLTVSKINGISGRSIRAPGDGNESGLQAISNDAAEISSAGVIVIALGTNPAGSDESGVTDMINGIKEKNSSARIFWVNIFSPKAVIKDSFNQVLTSLSGSLGFTIIDTTGANIQTGDGVHPKTGADYETYAKAVVQGVVGGGVARTNGCNNASLLPGSDNAERAYNYFVSKGLTAFQAAGIVGNMSGESGVIPTREQGQPADKVVSSADVKNGSWSGGPAWGLVQWDPPTKMIDPSIAANKSYQEIDSLNFQLDYLWESVSGEDTVIGMDVPKDSIAYDDIVTFKATTTVEDATIWFAQKFERCAQCGELSHVQPRVDFARNLLNKVGGAF